MSRSSRLAWLTSLAVLILAVLSLPGLVAGLFEDEAGVIDWHKTLLGTPIDAHFAIVDRVPRVFVTTTRNVVGAINFKTGAVEWRHIMPHGESIVAFAGLKHWAIATLSRVGESLRARVWDPASGNLRWEVVAGSSPASGIAKTAFVPSGDLLVGTGSSVALLDRKSGSKTWIVSLGDRAGLDSVWHVASDSLIVVSAQSATGSATTLSVLRVALADGKTMEEYTVPDLTVDRTVSTLANLVQIVDASAAGLYLVAKPSGQAPIVTHKFGSRSTAPQAQAVQPGGPRALHLEGGASRPHGGVLVRLSDGGLLILSVEDGGKLKPQTQFDQRSKPMVVDTRSTSASDNHVVLTYAKPWKATITFEAINLVTDKVVPVTFPHSVRATGFPVRTFVDTTVKKDSPASYRFMVVFEDGSVHLFDQSGPVWKREESLADPADATFVEFAEEKLLSQETVEKDRSGPGAGTYFHRLRLHLKNLLETLTLGAAKPASTAGGNDTETKQIFRDLFGMRKMVLFLSRGGKLVALESEKGTTVWERYIAMDAADAGTIPQTARVVGRDILLIRTTAEQYPPVVTILLSTDVGDGKSFVITHTINAMDGTDFGSPAMTVQLGDLASAMLLPITAGAEQIHPVALVDSKNQVRILPETAVKTPAFEEFASKFFYFSAKPGATAVVGFEADFSTGKAPYVGKEAWRLDFPEGERLATVGKKPAYERIASIGRVRGDRSVLYKYLNPHMAVFGTIRENPSAVAIYVVDSVKGTVLYHAEHAGGGAVHGTDGIEIAYAENWIVYSFWNSGGAAAEPQAPPAQPQSPSDPSDPNKKKKKRRGGRRKPPVSKGQEIVALELYESGTPDAKLSAQSSYQLVRPYVLSQAYSFPVAIDALAITTTRSGITTREAIVVTPAGQLAGISRRWLDPRRPVGNPSADDKEEGLIPYQPALPFNPREVASYSREVLGIDRLKTAPAFLESTSLVLAYGLDVFFTRRMPSKAFDVLSEDFSRMALIATTLALLVGIYVARQMSNRKRLYDSFKT